MEQNLKLLLAIREAGLRQRDFARRIKRGDAFISQVINGRMNLKETEKVQWAEVLGKKTDEVF